MCWRKPKGEWYLIFQVPTKLETFIYAALALMISDLIYTKHVKSFNHINLSLWLVSLTSKSIGSVSNDIFILLETDLIHWLYNWNSFSIKSNNEKKNKNLWIVLI